MKITKQVYLSVIFVQLAEAGYLASELIGELECDLLEMIDDVLLVVTKLGELLVSQIVIVVKRRVNTVKFHRTTR